MRQLSIADIKQLESGEIIPSFSGKIETVYEQKRGIGEFGEWSLQNMIVSDSTGKVQVTWGGEDDMSELQGTNRLFECSEGKRGLTGIKWDIRTSNGKRYESIKITPSCKIKQTDLGGGLVAEPAGADSGGGASPLAQTHLDENGKLREYANYSRKVFQTAWDEATEVMKTIMPDKDAKEIQFSNWYDLKMRIAQHIAIEVSKIVRRERF